MIIAKRSMCSVIGCTKWLSLEQSASRQWCGLLRHGSTTSTTSAKMSAETHFKFSTGSLGLERPLVRPVWDTIRQLPEVATSWHQEPSHSVLDQLNRASQIFASLNEGGHEHLAVQSIMAESQQRLGLYQEALQTLETLQSIPPHQVQSIPNFHETILLALAKVHWTSGRFSESQELCESIIATYDDFEETFPTTNLHMASAMTGKALSQLAAMKGLEQAYAVRDYFQIAVKFLERHPPTNHNNALPQIVASSNAGIAEAVYNQFLEETNNVTVPMDAALRKWFQALQKCDSIRNSSANHHYVVASKYLAATIQANLAWGVLYYEKDRADSLSKASEYAKQALSLYDVDSEVGKEGLCRVLTIVAACYHQADSPVTAEGLLQSAIDRKGWTTHGTQSSLQLREAYLEYAKLCSQWEKREGDAQNLIKEAKIIDSSLPVNWQGKSGIHGSLWFWTPGEVM